MANRIELTKSRNFRKKGQQGTKHERGRVSPLMKRKAVGVAGG